MLKFTMIIKVKSSEAFRKHCALLKTSQTKEFNVSKEEVVLKRRSKYVMALSQIVYFILKRQKCVMNKLENLFVTSTTLEFEKR